MTKSRWHNADIDALGVSSERLEVGGKTVGGLITLGRGFIFYSSDPRLKTLDGCRFDSVAEARQAVERALRGEAGDEPETETVDAAWRPALGGRYRR